MLKQLTEKKQKLDQFRPLPPELVKNLDEWFKVELTFNSNAIEGNSLSRIETAIVVEKGTSAVISAKPLKDQLEAINHAKAVDFIKDLAEQKKSHQLIIKKDILAIHKIILSGIEDQWAGKYRQIEVFIKGVDVEFPQPAKVPHAMQQFIQWLQGQQGKHPAKIAADAHYKLVSIHPFIDGNGRVARLLMNFILFINDYPMAIIQNEKRAQYLEALNLAQTKKNYKKYYEIVYRAIDRSLDIYLKAVGLSAGKLQKVEKKPEKVKLLTIGQLAKATGETIHTLRFWTKEELLRVKKRTSGGYQLYEPSMVNQVREIRRLQYEQRLTISEIRKRP